jgi:hypothetical protein
VSRSPWVFLSLEAQVNDCFADEDYIHATISKSVPLCLLVPIKSKFTYSYLQIFCLPMTKTVFLMLISMYLVVSGSGSVFIADNINNFFVDLEH